MLVRTGFVFVLVLMGVDVGMLVAVYMFVLMPFFHDGSPSFLSLCGLSQNDTLSFG